MKNAFYFTLPIHDHGPIYGTLMGCTTSSLALWTSYIAHFLKVSHKWDHRHEWVKNYFRSQDI